MAKIPPPPEDRLWLYGVTRRTADRQRRGRLRRERLNLRLQRRLRTAEIRYQPSTYVEERVAVALERLRTADREVIYLVLWDGLDNEQAGRVLGCSANAVAVRLHRARARLRTQLSTGLPEPSVEDDNVTGMTKES